jgi:hypothetical protein
VNGDVRKNLAVKFDTRLGEPVDELRVGEPVLSGARIDAL